MSNAPIPPGLTESVRLSMVQGIGPRLRCQLLTAFGSPEAVFHASTQELQAVPGIGPSVAKRIAAANDLDAEAAIHDAWEFGIEVLTDQDANFPRLLQEIHDPPGVCFRRGQPIAEDELAVAIVGTRHSTHYGKEQAERLAAGLASAGITVVSGLARGIDAAAHRGALTAGGRTIAVLASGLVSIYPPEHQELAEEIAEHGWLISEAIDRPPTRDAFPQRNRIISGLSLGVIVVEAPPKSGALITATQANEQGREVFAVPGPINSRNSQGCHALIRDGATLVASVDDVLAQLGPLAKPIERTDGTQVRQPQEVQLNEIEQQVLQAINPDPTSIDVVTRNSELPIHRVLSTISVLEMRRLVRRVSGNQVARL